MDGRMEHLDSSKLSKVITTNRILEQLDSVDLSTLTSCLMAELGCNGPADFLSKLLVLLCPKLSHETLTTLKKTAVGLLKTLSNEKGAAGHDAAGKDPDPTPCSSRVTPLSNGFSYLSSDTFDYLGSFLSTPDRFRFGYLNRQCYIESQKLSFLLQSQNQDFLIIDDETVTEKIHNFALSVPKKLHLFSLTSQHRFNSLVSSAWFASLFTRLTFLSVTPDWLPHVPLKTLLKHSNYSNSSTFDNKIDLDIILSCASDTASDKLDKFSIEYHKLNTSHANNVRPIRCFALRSKSTLGLTLGQSSPIDIKPLLINLSGNYTQLITEAFTSLNFCNFQDMQAIFHENLTCFAVNCAAQINFDTQLKSLICDDEEASKCKLACLTTLNMSWEGLTNQNKDDCCKRVCDMLEVMDHFKLRQHVENLSIRETEFRRLVEFDDIDGEIFSTQVEILDKLLFSDDVDSIGGKLRALRIVIKDEISDLFTTQNYFQYFVQSASKIEKLNQDCNLKCITIEYDFITNAHMPFISITDLDGEDLRWLQDGDLNAAQRWIEDPVNLKKFKMDLGKDSINITMVDLSSRSFVQLFACLLDMFERCRVSTTTQVDQDACKMSVNVCLEL